MTSKLCTVCNAAPPSGRNHQRCSTCKAAPYCSRACQSSDWRYHKHVCGVYQTFIATISRPTRESVLALFLPESSKHPQFVWVPLGEDSYEPRPNVKDFMGKPDPGLSVYTESINASVPLRQGQLDRKVRQLCLDHRLDIIIRGNAQNDGSRRNECVVEILKGAQRHDWMGPLMVLSGPDWSEERKTFQDVTVSDFRVIVDYFKWYPQGCPTIAELDQAYLPSAPASSHSATRNQLDFSLLSLPSSQSDFTNNDVNIVRINDKGQMYFNGAAKYVKSKISKNSWIFDGKPTSMSKHLGIPLVMHKCHRGTEWHTGRDQISGDPDNNQEAVQMMITVEPEDYAAFGVLNKDDEIWHMLPVGSWLIARKDRKNLTANHVEAFHQFYIQKLQLPMQIVVEQMDFWKEEEIIARLAEFVKTHICREKFENFFDEFKTKKIVDGDISWG